MDWVIASVLGFAPGLFWLWYLHRKDVVEPEPAAIVLIVFVLGCGSAFLTTAIRPALDALIPVGPPWWSDIVDAFAVTAGGEELVKFAAFACGVVWHRHLDEPMDGILYGAAAGLGFASVENVVYVAITAEPALAVVRGFTATLAHVACSGTIGFFVGLAFLPGRRHRRRLLIAAGFGIAVMLHGIYDFFLFGMQQLSWISLLLALPLMLVLLALKIRWSRSRSHLYHPRLAG